MNSTPHRTVDESRWHLYKQLELLPASVPNPANKDNPFAIGLNALWRPLLGLLMDELVEEQQVEYLDRCWALNEWGEDQNSASSLRRLWVLME
ncbi:hypothetical protein [Leptolyngbya ohadii]|uniref:hypothetical protein n=1 Tax=Leptolyngbya ohadii TaxID=1962290 RepID=UPI001179E8F7|nr:hypothetical protein [Leptolyngbya ohadii]